MARIRSQHPGQWTDEDFVQMSPHARLLTLAIRNEADDQGIFEWKPVTLKMRLMPADNVDVAVLLEEMEAFQQVKRFSHGGKEYGVIRNFARYQRPKKPNLVHFMPSELRSYAGTPEDSSEPVGNQFRTGGELEGHKPGAVPQKGEIAPQRKEVGGNSREGSEDSDASASAGSPVVEETPEATAYRVGKDILGASAGGLSSRLRKSQGYDDARVIDLLNQAREKQSPREWVGRVVAGDVSMPPTVDDICPPDVYRNVL